MITKTIEVRDQATFIPMLAIKLCPGNSQDRYLLSRAGYGKSAEQQGSYILLAGLHDTRASYDPYNWGDKTRQTAHIWLTKHFDEIESGVVVDVQFIVGETSVPKLTEAVTAHI